MGCLRAPPRGRDSVQAPRGSVLEEQLISTNFVAVQKVRAERCACDSSEDEDDEEFNVPDRVLECWAYNSTMTSSSELLHVSVNGRGSSLPLSSGQ